jgi:pimeloyl-ACP methyl ester carboxylesterase
MTTIPTTKYAKSADVHIAYQVVGEGAQNLVLVPGWVSHIEYAWEDPSFSHFLRRLASFSRLILLDRRDTGLSDRVNELPTLEQRMDDVRAVMDAAGAERAALFGLSEGGPMCLTFAATYPPRTSALVLYGTFARMVRAPDYPIGLPAEVLGQFLERVDESWGTGSMSADYFAPSMARDEAFRRSWARFERLAVSPAGIKALLRMTQETDARHALPVIRVPTLIMHREGDRVIRVGALDTSPNAFEGQSTWSCPGPTISRGSATPMPSSTRSRSSSLVPAAAKSLIGSWPQSCSLTSLAPRSGLSRWATGGGAICSTATTP